jgi:hypothetical protein
MLEELTEGNRITLEDALAITLSFTVLEDMTASASASSESSSAGIACLYRYGRRRCGRERAKARKGRADSVLRQFF